MNSKKASKFLYSVTLVLTFMFVSGPWIPKVYAAPYTAAPKGSPAGLKTPDIEPGGTIDGKRLYLIYTADGLRSIGADGYGLDMAYMLASDSIDLTGQEWKPIGTADNPFTGYFDGNGCEIKGLTMTDPNAKIIGMFGVADSAILCNITLKDYDILSAGRNVYGKTVAPILAWNSGTCKLEDNHVYPKKPL